jgi:predicted  nucleic acid-binding Zn-ribbon protein
MRGWADSKDQQQMKGLDEQVQEIKSDVLDISQELSRLEEKLLYPSGPRSPSS